MGGNTQEPTGLEEESPNDWGFLALRQIHGWTCFKLSETQGRLLTYRTIHEYTCVLLSGKESTCNAGDMGLTPGLGRFPGEGIGYPLQYSWASRVAQLVKNPPAMRETWV